MWATNYRSILSKTFKITMKLNKFIWRSILITYLTMAFATANFIFQPRGFANSYSLVATDKNSPPVNRSYLNLRPPKPQPLDGKNLQKSLDNQNFVDVIRQVELGWQYQYQTYYEGKLTTQYLELPEIQQELAKIDRQSKTKSALLYAVPRPDALHLILVTAKGYPIHKIVYDAKAKNITEVAQTMRLNVVNPQTSSGEYLPPAQLLDRWLIQPIATDLKAKKIDTILFCLGTGLRGLPLAALHDGQQYLVERYNFSIIPAFNLLDRLSSKLRGLKVLATGASNFTDNPKLPAVPIELATITQHGLWSGKVLLNEAFTLKKFQQARSQNPYAIVHLATHADISAKSVKDSYIQFWDRRLQLNEVRELGLDKPAVQLLVLSACRTALGTPNAELGFAGLSVQSGAKAVLASLWSVDDVGTLVLMSKFYQQLKTAPFKSMALRNTQIAMLKGNLKLGNSSIGSVRGGFPSELQGWQERDLSHPYYWAAFTTIGNPW
jgi:CHAT domain-containing protein